jgi:PLP dependent protein
MHQNIKNLQEIEKEIYLKNYHTKNKIKIIAVSKTFSISDITPLIDYGHTHFGENKVQEALNKWPEIISKNHDLKLHMIGKLQTNKVKQAVSVFDYIHSVDSLKLARKISVEQNKIKKNIKLFIQVNIGNENQKNGISIDDSKDFYECLSKELKVNIIGLMCIPPVDSEPEDIFNKMNNLNNKIGLKELSMGMSSDYLTAIKYGASFIRVGSKIFGKRT